ncbi:BlaI/MecI/CopY family transcriptional regulator [Anaerotignum lactatifermentans]|uniref:BlaI/MecI/CopY family transcriptional regulator n=1 Tax=Anaerotignum lactatifermentans TaxID=160404 RepID=A0ABS2G843_9FIRM|nr:BlaI/MecI/CopY family transcriptional regulator [Anaerotignum lactatifermentans]MBM6828351.1 BlaI/MecI/CopY family transcriptional regulator [Anaerotignum lactatifermentans]MBM6877631.1 BlaI/MecI/CopY family transcriptional regulator [Anaerotignum lactatifermentans]MBM6949934.1 BlaI/MecI/CopY family transcriptional regulator [Anaerotignum lactatifermentans]
MQKLPDTELEIMQVIWKEGRVLSTSEIKELLEEHRPWNISALQTLLNRLIDRGFLDSYKEGKSRYYQTKIKEKDYLAFENSLFLQKVNANSLTKLVASLYQSNSITDEDLDELAKFIEEKTRGGA